MALFREFFRELGDDPFWPTGKWWKRLGDLLDYDRARMVPGQGDEIQLGDGRFFNFRGGAQIAAQGGPFVLVSLDGSGNLLLGPGTVNGLVPSNPFSPISCPGNLTFVSLRCQTDSFQVNTAAWNAGTTPPTPPLAIKGAPPTQFDVLIGIVKQITNGTTTSYQWFRIWPVNFNVVAIPQPWIGTDRDDPEPGQTPQETWYTWSVVAGVINPPGL